MEALQEAVLGRMLDRLLTILAESNNRQRITKAAGESAWDFRKYWPSLAGSNQCLGYLRCYSRGIAKESKHLITQI